MKTCTKCGEDKRPSAFYRDKQKRDGLRSSCMACSKVYYTKNRETILGEKAAYYTENLGRILEYRGGESSRVVGIRLPKTG